MAATESLKVQDRASLRKSQKVLRDEMEWADFQKTSNIQDLLSMGFQIFGSSMLDSLVPGLSALTNLGTSKDTVLPGMIEDILGVPVAQSITSGAMPGVGGGPTPIGPHGNPINVTKGLPNVPMAGSDTPTLADLIQRAQYNKESRGLERQQWEEDNPFLASLNPDVVTALQKFTDPNAPAGLKSIGKAGGSVLSQMLASVVAPQKGLSDPALAARASMQEQEYSTDPFTLMVDTFFDEDDDYYSIWSK